jgi:hypothetical protein
MTSLNRCRNVHAASFRGARDRSTSVPGILNAETNVARDFTKPIQGSSLNRPYIIRKMLPQELSAQLTPAAVVPGSDRLLG